MRWAIMVELMSTADDPAAAGAEARVRLDAAGLTDAKIAAVRKVYDHVGPYPEEERNFDAAGRSLGAGNGEWSIRCRPTSSTASSMRTS